MPNEFLDVRGVEKKDKNDLLNFLAVFNAAQKPTNNASLPPRTASTDENNLNYLNILKQDLRNQQEPYDVLTNELVKTGPSTVEYAKKPGPPKPHTDTSSVDSLLAVLALLNAPGIAAKSPALLKSLAKGLGLTSLKGIGTNIGLSYGVPKAIDLTKSGIENLSQYTSDPKNALTRGFELMSKNPIPPR